MVEISHRLTDMARCLLAERYYDFSANSPSGSLDLKPITSLAGKNRNGEVLDLMDRKFPEFLTLLDLQTLPGDAQKLLKDLFEKF